MDSANQRLSYNFPPPYNSANQSPALEPASQAHGQKYSMAMEADSTFSSWKDSQVAFERFQTQHHLELSVVYSKKVEAANKKLPLSVPRHPLHHQYVYIQYGCIHFVFGKPRPRSTGIRPNQS